MASDRITKFTTVIPPMKHFANLFRQLDSTTRTTLKVNALESYFRTAPPQDALWVIALFTSKRPRRTVSTKILREWAAELADIPLWLFEESYHIAGDLAETIALVLPPAQSTNEKSLSTIITELKALRSAEEEVKKAAVLETWQSLDTDERFLFNKLITGGFRVGVSKKLLAKGLAKALDKPETEIAHRLMGDWTPDTITYEELLLSDDFDESISKPYPFFLAYPVDGKVEDFGSLDQWMVEYKWDGIRGQLIKRQGQVFVWSRGEELINASFPEFQRLTESLGDDYVLDGEIVVHRDGKLGSFKDLQSRLGRKTVSAKRLKELPASIIVYDLLEYHGEDIRHLPQSVRRQHLETVVKQLDSGMITLSPIITAESWATLKEIREGARAIDAEGLMLKRADAPYQVGRKKGGWWKWKLDPYTIDAVMLYAQRGHGRRTNLYTDYTFAVWNDDGKLVTFAKAYSGLTDAEFKEVTRFVKANTIESFGPVRSVRPELVFEIAFEGISKSSRHKSGIALRFPRILRWRRDKKVEEANHLDDLVALLGE